MSIFFIDRSFDQWLSGLRDLYYKEFIARGQNPFNIASLGKAGAEDPPRWEALRIRRVLGAYVRCRLLTRGRSADRGMATGRDL